MNRVALFTHPVCLEHDMGPYHPECPDRLRAIAGALEHPDFTSLLRERAPPATLDQLALNHGRHYAEAILAIHVPDGEIVQLDADTALCPATGEAALRAAGGAIAAVDAVLEGWADCAFAAVRPPGHHAEPNKAMGFCFFNNAAIAAQHARAKWGLARVAVVDFDVHHGNGTQDAFAADPTLFYASSHQSPAYPGTGSMDERGVSGNIANLPLRPGSGSREFRAGWDNILLPALIDFRPELIVVSAGFDAHQADPLADLRLETGDFAWITDRLLEIGGGRLVSTLEGGYDLTALAASAAAHVRAMLRA